MTKKQKPQKHQQFALPRANCLPAQVALNRARIARQEQLVREGKLRPMHLPSGAGAALIGGDTVGDYLDDEWDR